MSWPPFTARAPKGPALGTNSCSISWAEEKALRKEGCSPDYKSLDCRTAAVDTSIRQKNYFSLQSFLCLFKAPMHRKIKGRATQRIQPSVQVRIVRAVAGSDAALGFAVTSGPVVAELVIVAMARLESESEDSALLWGRETLEKR